MVRHAQIKVIAAGAGQPRGELRPDEGAEHGQRAARQPHPQNQKRRVYVPGHHIRIDENAGADNATHHDHGGVEEPQLPPGSDAHL